MVTGSLEERRGGGEKGDVIGDKKGISTTV